MAEIDMSDVTVETTDAGGMPTMEPAAPPVERPETPEPAAEASADETPEPAQESAEPPYVRADDGTFKSKAKKGSLQWRIDQKSWEAGEARRQAQQERTERERLSARLAEYEAKQAPAAPSDRAITPVAPAPDGRPHPDDTNPDGTPKYSTYEDLAEAIADWKVEQKFKARDAEQQRTAAAQQALNEKLQFYGRQEQYAPAVADYWEVVHTNANRALSNVMVKAINTSEHGPAIIYHLGTHPDVTDRLTRESWETPVETAPLMRQLLEHLVSAPPASRPAQASAVVRPSVPTPIKPVGSGLAVAETPLDDLDTDTRIREMNRLEKKPPPRTFA